MTADLFDRYAALDPANTPEAAADLASVSPVLLAAIERRTRLDTRDTTSTTETTPGIDQEIEPGRPPTTERLTPDGVKRRWSGALVAAAGFAVVLMVGVAIFISSIGGDERQPASTVTTVTTQAPQPFTGADALAVADAYFAALETNDIDALRGLFAEDASTPGSSSLEEYFEESERFIAWDLAQGAIKTVQECVVDRDGGASFMVTCQFTDHHYVARLVGAPAVAWTARIRFDENGKISVLTETFGQPDYNVVNRPFHAWMLANHPEDAATVDCCGGETVEESITRGTLRAQYADEWAAYLDENGCTYEDFGC